MTARDILDVAWDLLSGSTEAEWRAAISRAYFAAFHAARNLLRDVSFEVPRGERAHGYLWLRLSNSADAVVDHQGAQLRELRHMRNWADYDLDRPMSHMEAGVLIRVADDIVEFFETLPTVPARLKQITEAIKKYERDVLKKVTWFP